MFYICHEQKLQQKITLAFDTFLPLVGNFFLINRNFRPRLGGLEKSDSSAPAVFPNQISMTERHCIAQRSFGP
jgi:hypothetical protein